MPSVEIDEHVSRGKDIPMHFDIYSTSRKSPSRLSSQRLDDESAQKAVVVIQGIGHS